MAVEVCGTKVADAVAEGNADYAGADGGVGRRVSAELYGAGGGDDWKDGGGCQRGEMAAESSNVWKDVRKGLDAVGVPACGPSSAAVWPVSMGQRAGEAIVLRTWPFEEADLLVSLLTREQGRIKGVARHAMRSRRRFGGALEPMTYVRARYAERPRQELVRLDAFEVVSSPLASRIDYTRVAALELVAEVVELAMPDGAPDDSVFRLV